MNTQRWLACLGFLLAAAAFGYGVGCFIGRYGGGEVNVYLHVVLPLVVSMFLFFGTSKTAWHINDPLPAPESASTAEKADAPTQQAAE